MSDSAVMDRALGTPRVSIGAGIAVQEPVVELFWVLSPDQDHKVPVLHLWPRSDWFPQENIPPRLGHAASLFL